MHIILTLSHILAKVVCKLYTKILKSKFSKIFHNRVATSLFEGFKQKEIFFNVTVIINTFLSKPIKKTFSYTNHIRQLCIGKDWLISVKYRLNFGRSSQPILTDINRYKQYKPILTDILFSLNMYRLISVNISKAKGAFFIHGKS